MEDSAPANRILFPTGVSPATGIFTFEILGVGELIEGKEAIDEQRQVNLVDNLSVTKASHQLKFGADYRWLAPFSSPFSYRQFSEFSGMGNAAGGALSGITLFALPLAYESNALLVHNFWFYGQDSWKIGSRLTLTYGLRWDINPALKGKNPANDPFTVTGLNSPSTMTLAPRGTPLYDTTYGNVAPRIGVAYQFRDGADRIYRRKSGRVVHVAATMNHVKPHSNPL